MKIVKKKSLGQNFLQDSGVLEKIISAGELTNSDKVLEIGPGEGALTKRLVEKVGKVVAIEKDERLKNEKSALRKLQRQYNSLDLAVGQSSSLNSKLKIYFADILEVNLPKILAENGFEKSDYKLIANIPYYITGKIIRLFTDNQEIRPKLAVLLTQKEVAERICASSGKQSILSLIVNYYAQPELIATVSRFAFSPAPKVDSAILKLQFKKLSPREEARAAGLKRLVKIGFAAPRKQLVKNLSNGLKINKEQLARFLSSLGLSKTARAEEVFLKQWLELLTLLNKEVKN